MMTRSFGWMTLVWWPMVSWWAIHMVWSVSLPMSSLWRLPTEVFGWFEDEVVYVVKLEWASRVVLGTLLCTRAQRGAPLEIIA